MKYSIFSLLTICVAATALSSCQKGEDDLSKNTSVIPALQQGSWRITLFNDSGKDETYHFTGYAFVFDSGKVTATKTGSTVNGTYAKGSDESTEKLILNFGAAAPFDELNDDWQIVESSATIIRLMDISGGNGGTDLLTFEKI